MVIAAKNGHVDVVRVLIRHRADVNLRDHAESTALKALSVRGSLEGVRLLLRLGAEVNRRDMYGMTPFIWACRNGHLEIAKILLAKGADPAVRDRLNPHLWPRGGDTALEWAMKQNQLEVVKWFVSGAVKLDKFEMQKARAPQK